MTSLFTTLSPQASTLATPEWLDLSAVMVGALFGALTAVDRKLDLIGAIGLGILVGLGGGLIRDTIMQVGNVYMVRSTLAVPCAIIAACVVFFFSSLFSRMTSLTSWIDIISVGLFAASGTDKPITYSMTFVTCILLGTITGVGGGMLRDIFLGDVPQIFRRGNLYALCAVAGSITYYVLVYAGVVKVVAAFACVFITCLLRWASLRFNILSPANIDLTPELLKPLDVLDERTRGLRKSSSRKATRQHPVMRRLKRVANAVATAMTDPEPTTSYDGESTGAEEEVFVPAEDSDPIPPDEAAAEAAEDTATPSDVVTPGDAEKNPGHDITL
jgi:uncharacterized membrane protein YeiH